MINLINWELFENNDNNKYHLGIVTIQLEHEEENEETPEIDSISFYIWDKIKAIENLGEIPLDLESFTKDYINYYDKDYERLKNSIEVKNGTMSVDELIEDKYWNPWMTHIFLAKLDRDQYFSYMKKTIFHTEDEKILNQNLQKVYKDSNLKLIDLGEYKMIINNLEKIIEEKINENFSEEEINSLLLNKKTSSDIINIMSNTKSHRIIKMTDKLSKFGVFKKDEFRT